MQKSTTRSTLMISMLTLTSALLGFGRESYIAFEYGATGLTDAFYVATVVPDILAAWISYALTNALIPPLKEELSVSDKSARSLADTVFWGATAILLCLTGLGFVLRGALVSILAPSFTQMEHVIAVQLLKVMVVSIVFTGLSGVLWGIHNAYENFFYPAMVGVVYNVVLLFTAVVLGTVIGIQSLAYAYLFGVCGRFAVQYIPLVKKGIVGWPKFMWHPCLNKILRSAIPILASIGVTTLNVIIDRMVASSFPAGQITDLNFAYKVGMLPTSIFGMSVATTVYTRFIKHRVDSDLIEMTRVYELALSWLTTIGFVIGSIFVIYDNDVVALLFRHGHFTNLDVSQTASPLSVFGYFLAFYLIIPMMQHFFYANNSNRFIFKVSVLAVVVNIIGSLTLGRFFGITGLALANSISQLLVVCVMYYRSVKRMNTSLWGILGKVLKSTIPIGCLFTSSLVGLKLLWPTSLKTSTINIFIHDITGTVIGFAIVLVYLLAVRNNPMSTFIWNIILKLNNSYFNRRSKDLK